MRGAWCVAGGGMRPLVNEHFWRAQRRRVEGRRVERRHGSMLETTHENSHM